MDLLNQYKNTLDKLTDLTLKKNEVLNLTAITNRDEFFEKMIIDSIIPCDYFSFANLKVLDLGTGGGFPGLPLAIVNPNASFVLMDSTAKKINHVNEMVNELELPNVSTLVARSEEYGKNHREIFDVCIARAVSSLKILSEIALPLVKVGGVLIAMKGPKFKEEIKEAKSILFKLEAEIINKIEYDLPSGDHRSLIIIKKNKITPKKYPRDYSVISK